MMRSRWWWWWKGDVEDVGFGEPVNRGRVR